MNMANDHWKNQPRVPAGNSNGGQFLSPNGYRQNTPYSEIKQHIVIISLDFFSEKALDEQGPVQLRKGIRNLRRKIERHQYKIAHPEEFWEDWHSFNEARKQSEINHWMDEIKSFEQGILAREAKMREKGYDNI